MIVKTNKGDLPVRFGMNALAKYGDLTGKSMNDVMKSLNNFGKLKLSELLAFIYVGFVDGARRAGEECKVADLVEVGDMMDDDPELINKIFEVYVGEDVSKGADSKKK